MNITEKGTIYMTWQWCQARCVQVKPTINHSRIRMGLSGLNKQRRKYNFIDNGRCATCNFIRKDAPHFFLKCPTYATQRNVLYREICHVLAFNIDYNLLKPPTTDGMKEFIQLKLYGSKESDRDTNRLIFDSIHRYIFNTKRFF